MSNSIKSNFNSTLYSFVLILLSYLDQSAQRDMRSTMKPCEMGLPEYTLADELGADDDMNG